MSYGGFEYNQGGFGYGGFDVMSGFGNDLSGGGFLGNQDGGKVQEKKSSKDKSSLIPVTIKQLVGAIRDTSADTYQIDGFDLASVRIMGLVESIEEHATNCNYRINDGTGVMECKYWIEKDSVGRQTRISNYSYVEIAGSLRDYEGRKHLFVFSIRKIDNFNEMTHHFLDVILVHLQHTRGPIPGKKSSTTASSTLSPTSYNSPFSNAPSSYTGGMMGSQLPAGRNLNFAMNDAGGKSGVKDKILRVFDQYGSQQPQGLSIDEAMRILKGEGLSFDIISRTVQYLTDEGLLYTTIDEDHFKTTESM